jgi:hypothetical protein
MMTLHFLLLLFVFVVVGIAIQSKARWPRVVASLAMFGVLVFIVAVSFDGAARSALEPVLGSEQAAAYGDGVRALKTELASERISILIVGLGLLVLGGFVRKK